MENEQSFVKEVEESIYIELRKEDPWIKFDMARDAAKSRRADDITGNSQEVD